MRHADGRLITTIERTTYTCRAGRTKPKYSTFSMHGGSHRKSESARMTLRPPQRCSPTISLRLVLGMSFLSKLSAGSAHDLVGADTVGAQQHDLIPPHMLLRGLRSLASSVNRRPSAFEGNGNSSSHATRLACMQSAGNSSGDPPGYLITNSADFEFSWPERLPRLHRREHREAQLIPCRSPHPHL
jgi:hypothetical protein